MFLCLLVLCNFITSVGSCIYHKGPSYCPLKKHVHPFTPSAWPPALVTMNLFTSLILAFQECYINGIHYIIFRNWLYPLNIMPMRIHPSCYIYQYLFLLIAEQYSTVQMCHSLTIHLLKDIWIVSSSGLL